MIKLDVQAYCHGCANFLADVEEPKKYYIGSDIVEMTDTIVRCEPVSYTHLDVYKRQAQILSETNERFVPHAG